MNKVSLKKVIGKGYKEFWNFKGRYSVVKGGRGSKKSATTALWIIYHMMKYPLANTLVLRGWFSTHKDSTYSQLKWAINRLGVAHLWEWKLSPLEIRYKPTGQKILFRGLNDPMSITSITVEKGHLCWAWWEEAFQVTNEDDFNKVDMSIRGELPEGYFKRHIITFNPWSEKHWLKKRFFDVNDPNILALTTTYQCNEFLSPDDIALFDWMKSHNKRRYDIEGMGQWGIAEGAIYTNWEELDFDYQLIAKEPGFKAVFGMDFGYTSDPTTLICSLVNNDKKELYIFDEHYEKAMLNNEIASMIKYKGYQKEAIFADSAEPKSIEEIRRYGIYRIQPAIKGPDSVKNGIQFVQQFKIYVHPKCVNTIIELNNYVWDTDKTGQMTNKPIDDYNHILDALRYSLSGIMKQYANAGQAADFRRKLGL
jgi:phage terminase large subunit